MIKYYIVLLLLGVYVTSCAKSDSKSVEIVNITTDKACYSPGDEVIFTIDESLPAAVTIRYRYLNETIKEEALSGTSWNWKVPATDYTGYLIDLYEKKDGGEEKIYGSIAVDVSSDWSRFPRYGFLSDFGQMNSSATDAIVKDLNRYHINGIQFYDCQYNHHRPLAGTPEKPDSLWIEIGSRDTYLSTIKKYINAAHSHNMEAMFYNLAYGALSDAKADGVSDHWYLYTDRLHATKEMFDLDNPPFKSDIWLLDPNNAEWQEYIADKSKDFLKVFDFDGYHIDQLGNRDKNLYAYDGTSVDLSANFGSFIQAMNTALPGKKLVMNAVNQYGQKGIAVSPVDFLYTEVWDPNNTYKDLASIITDNDSLSNGEKKSVLTAYMNYDLAKATGFFNTPGVLFTDAVIFAFGGAHLELGEHMLAQPYFPNNNLKMRADLKKALVHYYDFMVAYQNLLRDGGTFNSPQVTSADAQIDLNNWPPQLKKVSVSGKNMGNTQVIHLINFTNAVTMNWNDAIGTQALPKTVENFNLDFTTPQTVKKIWMASPDYNLGLATKISFSQSGSKVSFTLPWLLYWDMIVVEY